MDLELEGKVALVAAASKGLGRACAHALAAEGARVAICARTEAALSEAAREIAEATGAEVLPLQADLERAEDIERVVDSTVDRFGRLDILVSNTGGPLVAPFADLTDEHWQKAFEQVHLAVVRFLRAVLPHMRAQKWGRIVAIQSSTVKQPLEAQMLSNGIRPGIAGLFKALVPDLARDNITINVVLPGAMRTDRVIQAQTIRAEKAGRTLEEQLATLNAMIPLGRLGDPEELASLVAYIASERGSYMTGATVQVDGGMIRSNV